MSHVISLAQCRKAPMYRTGWRLVKPKPKLKPYAKLAAGIGAATTARTRRQEPVVLMENLERPVWNAEGPGVINLTNPLFVVSDTTRQEPVVQTDVHLERPAVPSNFPKRKFPWTLFANWVSETTRQELVVRTDVDLEKPAVAKPKSPWTLFASQVSEGTPVSARKRKVLEEFAELAPVAKKARIDLPCQSRASDSVVVPPTSLRKVEKARAQDDPTDSVSTTSPATVKDSLLPGPIRRPIVTTNFASSLKVKLEDIPLVPAPDVQVNTSISLNKLIQNVAPSISPPHDVPDVPMFEDDYVDHPSIPDVVMLEDDYVDLPLLIVGYLPEYGDHLQIDLTEVPNGGVPFNGGPVDVFAMLGFVPEFSETTDVDPLKASNNRLGNIMNGLPYAGPPVFVPNMVNVGAPVNTVLHLQPLVNATLVDPPYNPREPLFAPRPEVQPLHAIPQVAAVPEALDAPTMIVVQGQAIGYVDERAEAFNELFGDDGEEEEEEAGAPDALWTAAGVEELGNDDEDKLEIII